MSTVKNARDTAGRRLAFLVSPAARKLARVSGIDIAKVSDHSGDGRVRLKDVELYLQTPGLVADSRTERLIATPAARKAADAANVDISRVVGMGKNGRIRIRDVERHIRYMPENTDTADTGAVDTGAVRVKATPVARRMAEELGIDLQTIRKKDRITKEDVEKAAGIMQEAAVAGDNDLPPVKMNLREKRVVQNMIESWHTSPRVTYTRPVDATQMKQLRASLKDKFAEKSIKLTYNHIIMKACAQVLMEIPDMNASYSDYTVIRHKHANIGLAVSKDDSLVVPNVKNCESKSLAEIAQETEELINKVRSNQLELSDYQGGTFTISTLGAYGITSFSPIINQPELAILGVCDIVDTPVVRDDQIVIRPMMNLSLTADHRVISGVMAASFLQRVAELLENPVLMFV